MARPQVSFITRGHKKNHKDSFVITGQAYVQYIPPVSPPANQAQARPLLFVHGGGLTGSMWESTPDRRPGWAVIASRPPYCRPVYIIDAADSGRSQRRPDEPGMEDVNHRTASEMWRRFRFGPLGGLNEDHPSSSTFFPESQFPGTAFESLVALQSARRYGADQRAAEAAALRDAIAELGACDVIAHSIGCIVMMLALDDSTTRSLVKAFVMVEPPLPQGASVGGITMPSLLIWADYLDHDIWTSVVSFYRSALGKNTDIVALPDRGLCGNSHFPMLEKNNDAIIALILEWLVSL